VAAKLESPSDFLGRLKKIMHLLAQLLMPTLTLSIVVVIKQHFSPPIDPHPSQQK
jgi:hypothetical protein